MHIWAVADAARGWSDVIDVVPGMNNLTVIFDPLKADTHALAKQLEQAWRTTSVREPASIASKVVEVPVRYGGEDGPDLGVVAKHAGCTPEAVAKLHANGDYIVYFVGFQPGFGYLGGLDPRLHTPRRADPRQTVPAGSVAIGGEQTAIYPSLSPGGWQLIGRTDLTLFDPYRSPASLLQPGDRVRFTIESITA